MYKQECTRVTADKLSFATADFIGLFNVLYRLCCRHRQM